jgi:hypothetical protein
MDLSFSLLHKTQFVHFCEQGKEYRDDGEVPWAVRLAEQKGLRKLSTRPDLTSFMAITGTKGENVPRMTESLRLIIADMIALEHVPPELTR